MSKQLHKIFIDEQAKLLLKSYVYKEIKINYILSILGIRKGFKGRLRILIIRAKFASPYSFTLGKWVFFSLFLLPQNIKVAIYKGYIVSVR